MRSLLAFAAMLLAPAVQAESVIPAVPDAFVGEWASSPDLCGSERDDLLLRISPTHISHWESHGPIKAVVLLGRSEIAFIAELSDEGETWLSASTFRLSEDGLRLSEVTSPTDAALVRYKCGKTTQVPAQFSRNDGG